MSYEAVKWALYDAPMLLTAAGKPDTAARFVLVAHAERADKRGKGSYPGPAALMRATGYDERTIQRAEARLEGGGLLVRRGVSQLGTARWDLDMSKVRADDEQAQTEARVARRKALDAQRQRSRRERLKAAGNDDSSAADIDRDAHTDAIVTDAESVTSGAADGQPIETDVSTGGAVTDADSVTSRSLRPDVTDSASGCHGRNAPQTTHEPPMNHPRTIPGGTLPPDPLRPDDPSGRRTESGSSPIHGGDQPPQPDTATHDRARAGIAAGRKRTGCPKHPALPAGNRPDGQPRCALCRAGAPPTPRPDDGHTATVLQFHPRSA